MRGKAKLISCTYCGRRVPVDKANRIRTTNFRYSDDRTGLNYFGGFDTARCCPSCARHRHVKNLVPMKGRPKRR
ncbi:MAG: hypothetical protein J4432_00700 [DPANN group archaeon]|nr:hypothetical protein [DPANN group archaeon]